MSKDELREAVFKNYSVFISYAASKFRFLSIKGVPPEDLVNEAIITVLDCRQDFNEISDVINYVTKSINSIGWHENSLLKDVNFSTVVNKGGSFDIAEKKIIPVLNQPDSEFIKTYQIFSDARFGINSEKLICPNCKSTSFYSVATRKVIYSCKGCSMQLSATNRTYLHKTTLKYSQIYRAIILLCKNPKLSSLKLSATINCSPKTGYIKKRLIVSAMNEIIEPCPSKVLERILRCRDFEDAPIKLKSTRSRKYTPDQVIEMRRLYNDGIYNLREVAELFSSDPSTVRKIIKGMAYSQSTPC